MSKERMVEKICICLETLINGRKSESSPNRCCAKDKKEALFFELKKNVHFAFEVIEKYDDLKTAVKQFLVICHKKKCKTCDYLNFLELSVVLLKLLSGALLAEENEQNSARTKKASVPKGLLSISQQKIVKKSLQFVVALGILPNLLRGIGIPLSKRLEYAKMLEHFASDISPRQKQAQIAVCLETLLSCIERTALQSIILSNHETDILAALFQICHAPIKKIEPKNNSSNENCKVESANITSQASLASSSKNTPFNVNEKDAREKYFLTKLSTIKDYSSFSDQQLINEMVDDRNYFTQKLERFLKQMCPSLLLWELLLFQGIPIKSEDSEFTISKVPLWLRKICSQMLTDMILQNHGIASFVQVVLDKAYDVDVKSGKVDTVRLDAVARLIAYNPVRHISVEDYISRLSKQVLDLLRMKGSQMDTILHYVASSIILHICDRDMKSAEKYFLDVLFHPLWICVSTTNCESKVIVEEKVLSYCIEDIHKIFILSNSPLSRKHIKLLFPFFHCFSNMYFFLLEGISSLKAKVKNLLLNILSSASDEDAMSLLHAATFSTIDDKGILVYMTTVDFAYGEEGGIGAVKHVEDDFSDLDINCRAILGLLSELKNKNLNRSFVLLVLKVFCSYRNQVLKDPNDPKYERFRNLFLAFIQELIQQDIDVREALMSNVSEVIEILVTLLDTVLKWEDDDYDKTIMIALIILNILMFGNDELTPSEWAVLKRCLPSLEKLINKPINSYLKDMVSCIITYMATHGVVGSSSSYEEIMQTCIAKLYEHSNEVLQKEQNDDDDGDDSDESVETNYSHASSKQEHSSSANASFLNDAFAGMHIPESTDKTSYLASDLEEMLKLNKDLSRKIDEFTSFERAIQDIKDTSVPVKGHGLIAVGKLLSDRDKETLCYKKELLSIFQEGLENEDSYVYLSAIQCLSLLADIDAELVLPSILKVYQCPGDKNCEFILKAGEVLLKICRSLGELAYKYKDQLLHTYLIGAKHEDPRIRSSSLSNLGEACMHLKFNLSGHWLQEILMCVRSLLQTDRDLEVRRCAVMVITLLLRGIGRDIFQILENEIKDIYNQLKIVYATESDDVLRLHSQLALEEINTIMKEFFSVQLPLTKEIRILHP